MRLNRYLSQCGVASRRGAEEIILGGRVSINGHVVKELATQVGEGDQVVVDGSPVRTETPVVLALNKPKGYLCSRGDTHERMTIYDLLPQKYQNLHHVGRLDKESEGIILLTNRGDLSHRLIHPSQGAEKEYEVVVDQAMTAEVIAKLVKGMMTEEGFARAERAWLDTAYRAHIVLKMGLKRQIRMMLYYLGYEVTRLTRIRIGWLKLHGLAKGSYKELTPVEVERFFKEETNKPKLGRKPVNEDDVERRQSRPARDGESRKPGFKPSRGKRSGPSGRFADAFSDEKPARFKPKRDSFSQRSRSDGTGRGGHSSGRSGPPARRPVPRGPRRGPSSR